MLHIGRDIYHPGNANGGEYVPLHMERLRHTMLQDKSVCAKADSKMIWDFVPLFTHLIKSVEKKTEAATFLECG